MPTTDQIERLLRDLEATPVRLAELFAGRDDAALRARGSAAEWSALDVLIHLRASDEIIAPRLVQLLVRDDPPLPAFDERRWADVVGYAEYPPALLLARFAARRDELLHALRRRDPAVWEQTGHHEEYGTLTLWTIASRLAAHEAEHLTQLTRLLSDEERDHSRLSG